MDFGFFTIPLFWGVFIFKVFITYHKSFGNAKNLAVEEQIKALFGKKVVIPNSFPQKILKWVSKTPYIIAIYPFGAWELFVFMFVFSALFQMFVVYPIFYNRLESSEALNDTLDMMLVKTVVESGIGTKEDVFNRLLDLRNTEYKNYI